MDRLSLILKDCGALAILAFFSLGVGVAYQGLSGNTVDLRYETPAMRLISASSMSSIARPTTSLEAVSQRAEIQIIDHLELQALLSEKKAFIVDVRPSLFYQIGHIKGASNLQQKAYIEDYPKLKQQLFERAQDGCEIVLYCAGAHCPDAGKVAKKLAGEGLKNISIFEEGWEVWQKKNLPKEATL